jgi:hypothetical protein
MIYRKLVYSEGAVGDLFGFKDKEDVKVSVRGGKPHKSGRTYLAPLLTEKNFPHFYDQAYVGVEFASELVEAAYRYHTFVLKHQAELKAFLASCMVWY